MAKLLTDKVDSAVIEEKTIADAVEKDLKDGRVPSIFLATTGTTGNLVQEDLSLISKVCKKYDMWLHADAAYLGSFGLVDKSIVKDFHLADSINVNGHK